MFSPSMALLSHARPRRFVQNDTVDPTLLCQRPDNVPNGVWTGSGPTEVSQNGQISDHFTTNPQEYMFCGVCRASFHYTEIDLRQVPDVFRAFICTGCKAWANHADATVSNNGKAVQVQPTEGEESDDSAFGSWTRDDDECGNLYFDIKEQMKNFRSDSTRDSMRVFGLSRSQRRIVHSMAHLMRLQHKSEGNGRRRDMLISKGPHPETIVALEDALKDNPRAAQLDPDFVRKVAEEVARNLGTSTIVPAHTTDDTPRVNRTNSFSTWAANDPIYSSGPESGNISVGSAVSSGGSGMGSSASRKRRRLPRVQDGYGCHHCQKTFDLRCDLTQHLRIHTPEEEKRFVCDTCQKRFVFGKDLRRHEKIHGVTEWMQDAPDMDAPQDEVDIDLGNLFDDISKGVTFKTPFAT